MAVITKDYLDQKLQEQTEAILGVVKQGFDENTQHFDRLEQALTSLTNSVDTFVKTVGDAKQELLVLRKQLKEIEERVSQLEVRLKTT